MGRYTNVFIIIIIIIIITLLPSKKISRVDEESALIPDVHYAKNCWGIFENIQNSSALINLHIPSSDDSSSSDH
jgi:hypothetical protein